MYTVSNLILKSGEAALSMKRTAFFLLGLTLALSLFGCEASEPAPSEAAGVLRYDGIYCYIRDFDYNGLTNNYALRFYEDGTVIHASVEQREKDSTYFPSASWFNKESEFYTGLLGSYELTGGSITLTTYGQLGSVDYQGTVLTDRLVLNSRSNANGYEVTGSEYVFYPFDEIQN